MFKNLRKKKKGFTLIELIIVIAIIAILAAVAIPRFGAVRQSAAIKADVANAKTIANSATTLIAEGKIKLPAKDEDNLEYTIGVSNPDPIGGYLQNIPTPKSDKDAKNFFVTIDEDGIVEVFLGEDGNQVFPAAETDVE